MLQKNIRGPIIYFSPWALKMLGLALYVHEAYITWLVDIHEA